jgi:CheY-like chemotaxis protein
MAPESGKLLVQVLRKIPIFKGLSPSQVRKVLGICTHKSYKPGSAVCKANTPGDEMYVLLSGELLVATAGGVRVATILPVTVVGEMGVITGQPRVATVEASKPSNIFVIQKSIFDLMMRDDRDMRATIYKNIIDVLADKLSNDNIRLRDHQLEKGRLEGRLAVLERQLKEQKLRVSIAVEMVVEKGGLALDEVELDIADRVKDLIPRVLVVDDEKDFRRLMREALSAFAVVEAGDGQEALGMVQEEKLDLVITDIRMPNMDGLGLLKTLRSQHPSLPVLAVSGYLEAEEIQQYGFDGFIEKPVNLPQLQELVEQTLRQGGDGQEKA